MGLELDAGGVSLATLVASLTRELTEGSGPQDEVLAVAPSSAPRTDG